MSSELKYLNGKISVRLFVFCHLFFWKRNFLFLFFPKGFGNHHISEAIPGALPEKQNSPQHPPLGLYVVRAFFFLFFSFFFNLV